MWVAHILRLACLFLALHAALSCTTVHVHVKDSPEKVIARTMELGFRAARPFWNLEVVPRGSPHYETHFPSSSLVKQKGNRFGYASLGLTPLSVFPKFTIVTEGMNEHGLTMSAQVLQVSQYAKKQDCGGTPCSEELSYIEVLPFVLGNFVDAISAAKTLLQMRIVDSDLSSFGPEEKLHYSLDDADGNSLVLEVLAGKLYVYNNTVGVMTNDPDFGFHIRNLGLYTNIGRDMPKVPPTRQNPFPTTEGCDICAPLFPESAAQSVPTTDSHGLNLLGLPGDYSPAGRFVRMFYLRNLAEEEYPCESVEEAMSLATNLLNTVSIPYGTVGGPSKRSARGAGTGADAALGAWRELGTLGTLLSANELTQWAVLKLPHSKRLLWRTYENNQWNELDVVSW
eukprot:CAMPEP_0177631000 /NCGR_PEP_ID=MMETSP0447-20121125/1516_1 /TAXON_ID=0 /ORGANISM="Stygamoeba regulata, Strain BSH-02190019" /LENGTH=396 /DNA_ID=CAMNT_0019132455 /DNA_START=95 /DNA_END=1282 /DNA_ORIENTATION=+